MKWCRYVKKITKLPERAIVLLSKNTGEIICVFDATKTTVDNLKDMLADIGVSVTKEITSNEARKIIEVDKDFQKIFWLINNVIV